MLTLLSPRGTLRATAADHDDGVHVIVRRSLNYVAPGNLLARGVVDAPFHLVCDRLTDLLAELEEADV